MRELILGKEVIIHTQKDKEGKYGRYIAEVFLKDPNQNWVNLNNYLLEQKMAELY